MTRAQTGSSDAAREARLLRLAALASVTTAALLVVVKLFAWWATGSVSMLASLLDSVLDGAASLLTLLAVRYALVPADREHRFGHGKAEPLAALLQACMVLGSCAFIATEAVHRLLDPVAMTAILPAVLVMVFAIAATAALTTMQGAVLKRTQSPAIHADRLHYLMDLFSNAATLVALALSALGLPLADPILALAIAAWMLFAAREILGQALDQLLDRELPTDERQLILDLACGTPGVGFVNELRTRRAGRTRHVQLTLSFDAEQSLGAAVTIAETVKNAILRRFADADVLVVLRAVHAGATLEAERHCLGSAADEKS
ncbi:MAG: cation diffusion facilitator family transporter [Halieaceae bacterium]|jgi:ferrous-iron efflux pump FieF|nr:cation diffusion facilitator family transporter [Halieaceae bacterium]